MKIFIWFRQVRLLFGLAVINGLGVTLHAAAPASLAGFVYYDRVDNFARRAVERGLMLENDGAFRGLYAMSDFTLLTHPDGTWNYHRVNETDGELTLASNGEPQKRTLRFSSEFSGFIVVSTLAIGELSGSFQIASAAVRPPLVNCSNRSFVRTGGAAFTGFVIAGDLPRVVLIRAVGPGLNVFGIKDTVTNPTLTLTRDSLAIFRNDDWDSPGAGESIRRVSAFVGAFPLVGSSKDSALVVRLAPGAYVAETSAVDAQESGQVIVEIYMLP